MTRIDPFAAGLTLGGLMGAAHAAWIALVAVTATVWATNVILPGHVVPATFVLDSVDVSVAAFLVVMTTFAGCGLGWLFAAAWNGLAALRAPVLAPQVGR